MQLSLHGNRQGLPYARRVCQVIAAHGSVVVIVAIRRLSGGSRWRRVGAFVREWVGCAETGSRGRTGFGWFFTAADCVWREWKRCSCGRALLSRICPLVGSILIDLLRVRSAIQDPPLSFATGVPHTESRWQSFPVKFLWQPIVLIQNRPQINLLDLVSCGLLLHIRVLPIARESSNLQPPFFLYLFRMPSDLATLRHYTALSLVWYSAKVDCRPTKCCCGRQLLVHY